jgi:type I restriction enzyme S subunit
LQETGEPWLGAIPADWAALPIKRLFEIRKRIAGELGHDVLSVTQQGLRVRDIDSNDGQLSMDYSKYQIVEVGDFVMNHMDLLTGYVDIAATPGVTSPDYRVFAARTSALDPKYFLYVFQNGYRQRIFYAFGQGSSEFGRWRMPTDSFNSFVVPIPPPEEQATIAAFLDRETRKIDALVEEQRQLIELLKEKRQAVISHAVTKGLDPNAEMKPSGVEWLGNVPEHWEVVSVRRIASFVQTGRTPTTEVPEVDAGELPWYTPGDFGAELKLADASKGITKGSVDRGEANLFPAGSVLVVSIGATLGKVGLALRQCSANQQINAVLPSDRIDAEFLAWSLSAKVDVMRYLANASTIGIMNQEKTKEIRLALPLLEEQQAICRHLASSVEKLAAMEGVALEAIGLLQERRAALISASVTGKFDVRGTSAEATAA